MRRYKVLSLEWPFTSDPRFWRKCVEVGQKVEPVFNRDGLYLDRQTGLCWMEVGGEAWKEHPGHFAYSLSRCDGNNRLHPDLFNAISLLKKARLASERQKEMWEVERDMRVFRLSDLSARKMTIAARKRLRAFKENHPSPT